MTDKTDKGGAIFLLSSIFDFLLPIFCEAVLFSVIREAELSPIIREAELSLIFVIFN